jgi:serine/threonine protein kinase
VSVSDLPRARRAQLLTQVEREIQLMRALRHDNIVAYLGTERARGVLRIFMEYVPGGACCWPPPPPLSTAVSIVHV